MFLLLVKGSVLRLKMSAFCLRSQRHHVKNNPVTLLAHNDNLEFPSQNRKLLNRRGQPHSTCVQLFMGATCFTVAWYIRLHASFPYAKLPSTNSVPFFFNYEYDSMKRDWCQQKLVAVSFAGCKQLKTRGRHLSPANDKGDGRRRCVSNTGRGGGGGTTAYPRYIMPQKRTNPVCSFGFELEV